MADAMRFDVRDLEFGARTRLDEVLSREAEGPVRDDVESPTDRTRREYAALGTQPTP